MTQLSAWLVCSGLLAAGLVAGGLRLADVLSGRPYQHDVAPTVVASGLALALLALVVAVGAARRTTRRKVIEGLASAELPDRVAGHPYWTMFIISFAALFTEVMLIRYCGSQIRIFSFYKNVPLIGAFLGLGLGCCLAQGRPRHVLSLLLWLVPMAFGLSAGALLAGGTLGQLAATASSEQILGDFAPGATSEGVALASQALIALFCLVTLVAVTLLFALLGRLLGDAFGRVERLPGYTVNILGSLAGILFFTAASFLETPPWVWFVLALLPLLWWLPRGPLAVAALVLVYVNAAAVAPEQGETVWSRYQKLVGHAIAPDTLVPGPAYLVEISDVFYQMAVDRRPATLARASADPFPHYGAVYSAIPVPRRVLIVGAGTGNDVAEALRAGASEVVAVDIDPAIVEMGRAHHPERPYDDPRVRVIVDDARRAFRRLPADSFDLVVFGLLDSHTQLGISSVRLDNYVFTMESFADARRLVRPGGHIAITAAAFRPWFRRRFAAMLSHTVGHPVRVMRNSQWFTYIGRVGDASPAPVASDARGRALPTDDWPFLYLPSRSIPTSYLIVVGCMALASVATLRLAGLRTGRFGRSHGHLFLLGAAFLLMEVHAINRLALLFGTTWLVSALTIALVLILIVGANVTVTLLPRIPYGLAYGALAASLAASWWIEPSAALAGGAAAGIGFGAVLLSPVYFAGLVFARSFGAAPVAETAIGANILGSVLGGWAEYATMAVGMRPLVLIAAAFYLGSLLLVPRGGAVARD